MGNVASRAVRDETKEDLDAKALEAIRRALEPLGLWLGEGPGYFPIEGPHGTHGGVSLG